MKPESPATGKVWNTERRTRLATALLGVLFTLFAGHLALLRLGTGLQYLSYDIPFLVHRAGTPDDVRIVYLDELDGTFLDRRSQAPLLDRLNEAGVRAVVYDIIFDLPSEDPQVDQDFAAAMRRFRGVDANDQPVPGLSRRPVLLACGRRLLGKTAATGEQLIPPNDELLAAADDFGLVAFIHDEKFTVRELVTGTPDEPSLTWKAAVNLGIELKEEERLASRWINYAGPPPSADDPNDPRDPHDPDASPAILAFSATDLLGDVPSFLRNKIVVVGAKPGIAGAAAGLDLFSTPFHRFDRRGGNLPLMSGVELQANSLANLLRGNWLTRSGPEFDRWMVILAGILAGTGFTRMRPIHGVLVGLLSVLLLIALGIFTVHYEKLWFPWSVVAFVQLPVAVVWGTAAHFYVERFLRVKLDEEQRQLRAAFAKYLSPQMLDRLTTEGFRIKMGGEKVETAMMFTDLEAFTELCERIGDPERIVATLNDYFKRTIGHIFEHDGIVIKFIGDAIFAAWGAPIAEPEASLKAVSAAWKLFQSDKLVVEGEPLKTRIGLHFGEVVAGNVGSAERVDYTLMGDAVNVAARLEAINKQLGTRVLMSDAVHDRIGTEFRTRRIGCFRLKGRREPTMIHELLGPVVQPAEPEWITRYHRALAAFEANDPVQARALFAAVDSMRSEGDGPSKYFIAILDRGAFMSDGIVEMT